MTELAVSNTSSVLRERNMRWYLGGQIVSLTGSMLQNAVLALLVVSMVGKEVAATWVGIVWSLALVPGMLFGPFAGTLLDRWDKRRVLSICAAVGTLQALALAYLAYTGQVALWQLVALALVMGFVNAIDGPGRNAIVKDAVMDKRNVRQASKLFTSLYSVAQVVGPGLAGPLVALFGYAPTFLLNALSFVALIVALANMSMAATMQRAGASVWHEVREGGRYTFKEPGIRLCILLTTGVCVFGYSYNVLLAVINKYMLGGDETSFSYLAASSGFGWVAGAILASALGKRFSHKALVVAGLMWGGVSVAGVALTTHPYAAAVLIFNAGAGFMLSFTTLRSSMVHLAKQEAMGAVMGYAFSFFYCGMVMSATVMGPLADHFGLPAVLMLSGASLVALALLTPFLPGIDELD